jgi:hypothetical protein
VGRAEALEMLYIKPRSVNGKSWIGVKEADLVRDATKSLDAEPSPSG